jgi:nicotinamide mononucleotide transporter
MGFLLQKYTEASLPYWDATTTAYSVIAQWLLARKKLENWLFWIFINVLCVGIYYVKDLTATAILYFVLLLIAIKGYAQWREGMFKQPQAAIA